MGTRVMTVAVYDEGRRWTFPQASLERVREGTPDDVEVRLVGSRTQLLEAMPETDFLIGFPFTGAQFLLHEQDVSWIQLTGRVGASLESVHQLLESGIRVTTAAGARATQVAEHALMLTLALLRGLSGSIDGQRSHRWEAGRLSELEHPRASALLERFAGDASEAFESRGGDGLLGESGRQGPPRVRSALREQVDHCRGALGFWCGAADLDGGLGSRGVGAREDIELEGS